MRDNVTATERCGWLMRFHTCVKEKVGYLSRRYGISIHQWHTKYSCFLMLNSLLLLIISRWIMVWNKSVWMTLFTNVYQYDVIITSSATINSYFLHCQNLPFLSYAHCSFCLNWHIFHADMKETVSGCFFLNTVYVCMYMGGPKKLCNSAFCRIFTNTIKDIYRDRILMICVCVCVLAYCSVSQRRGNDFSLVGQELRHQRHRVEERMVFHSADDEGIWGSVVSFPSGVPGHNCDGHKHVFGTLYDHEFSVNLGNFLKVCRWLLNLVMTSHGHIKEYTQLFTCISEK